MKAIVTKYLGPGNVRGSRIKADDGDGNTVTVGYDYAASHPHRVAAVALCAKMGWDGTLIEGGIKGGNVYVWAEGERVEVPAKRSGAGYQPKTGERCTCRPGVERDNCAACEGTGQCINFAAIRARRSEGGAR